MGRQANTNRNYFIWCFVLTVGGALITSKYIEVKYNYTDLHHRVNQIERIINERNTKIERNGL